MVLRPSKYHKGGYDDERKMKKISMERQGEVLFYSVVGGVVMGA